MRMLWSDRVRERLPRGVAVLLVLACLILVGDAWLGIDITDGNAVLLAILRTCWVATAALAIKKPVLATLVFSGIGFALVMRGEAALYMMYVISGFILLIGFISTASVVVLALLSILAAVVVPAFALAHEPWVLLGPVLMLCAPISVCALVLAGRRDRIAAAEVARQHTERLHHQIRLRERHSLARSMHDNLGHSLTVISMVAASRRTSSDVMKLQEALTEVESHARAALSDTRTLLQVLRDDEAGEPHTHVGTLAQSDSYAVIQGLDRGLETMGFHVMGKVDPAVRGLPPLHSESLIRIMQEAFANITKYAPADTVIQRDVNCADQRIELEVVSPLAEKAKKSLPGGAFWRGDPSVNPVVAGSTNYGIIGIHERVTLLGGEAYVGPCEGAWTVRASWPLKSEDATVAGFFGLTM